MATWDGGTRHLFGSCSTLEAGQHVDYAVESKCVESKCSDYARLLTRRVQPLDRHERRRAVYDGRESLVMTGVYRYVKKLFIRG